MGVKLVYDNMWGIVKEKDVLFDEKGNPLNNYVEHNNDNAQ